MSQETRKVLDMFKEGKITSEDAERLLEKLGAPSAAGTVGESGKTAGPERESPKKPRYLRIQVERPGEKNVNVRMPLSFVRNSRQLLSFLPAQVAERLRERGIFVGINSLHGLMDEDFAEALENINVDVDQEDGKKVRIYCE